MEPGPEDTHRREATASEPRLIACLRTIEYASGRGQECFSPWAIGFGRDHEDAGHARLQLAKLAEKRRFVWVCLDRSHGTASGELEVRRAPAAECEGEIRPEIRSAVGLKAQVETPVGKEQAREAELDPDVPERLGTPGVAELPA